MTTFIKLFSLFFFGYNLNGYVHALIDFDQDEWSKHGTLMIVWLVSVVVVLLGF